ncbi:hypothetical protein RHSIM_Rhsim02G0199100 [Rhododendron simsii]|uniref:Uncharacterized protein n=1 Tax=Rhododendron simsii TaxID=118357 RepID=A0A834HAU1_RHOSS|nr:hypothetical protein RHSIM_Rhsim02G0199100 [Rhododendron simsii]
MLDGRSKPMTCALNSSQRVVLIERMHPTTNSLPAPAPAPTAPLLFVSASSPRRYDSASYFGNGGFELGMVAALASSSSIKLSILRLEVHCERLCLPFSLSLSPRWVERTRIMRG